MNLKELSLEDLLDFAAQKGIRTNSRISRCIVQADIARFIGKDLDFFGPDPEGRSIALEAGVDVRKFDNSPETPRENPNSVFRYARTWLSKQGVASSYLEDSALLSAVGAVIFERKLPFPEEFSYHDVFWCQIMSLTNFRTLFSVFSDDTPEDYLLSQQMSGHILMFLLHQSTEDLIRLAEQQSFPIKFFRTRAGALDYLVQAYMENPQVVKSYLLYCSSIHQGSYPERFEYTKSIIQRRIKIPSFVRYGSQIELLAQPPTPFEKRCIEIIKSNSDYWRVLQREFPVLQEIDEYDIPGQLAALQSDPRFSIADRQELWSLSRSKSIRKATPELLFKLTGWKGVVKYQDIPQSIFEYHLGPQFGIITDMSLCSNKQDVFLNDFRDLAITYGTFTDFVCYNPEELQESFIVDDHYVAFRIPTDPEQVFPSDEIKELEYLVMTNELLMTRYRDRIMPLILKIRSGLVLEVPADIEAAREVLFKLIPEDRLLSEAIFRDLFEAGMTQRTWIGGPWPMRYEETLGSSQEVIEGRMTPLLNDIREKFDKLTPSGKNILRSLPVVNYEPTFHGWIRMTDSLLGFEKQTREGLFCIGYGSQLMVYSGYFYLTAIDVLIPGFDLDEFDPRSTHR